MSNDRKMPQPERKKEHTSVLEQIRRRTGLLVGIVGLALVIFILESLLGSGASIFGSDDMIVGSINGKKIDRNEFLMRYENQLNNYRQRTQGREADDAIRSQAQEAIWNQYIIELVMKPQFNAVGIVVGEDELYESVVVNPVETIIQNLTDQNTGRVNEQFARPDGSLDPVKWRQAVQNVTGDNEMAVAQMEEQVRSTRYFEKFRNIINKGLYVTKAESKQHFENQNTLYSINFVIKRYDEMADSAVTITDSEIEKYYKEHSYLYKNPETRRSIEYVTYDVLPSSEDLAAVEKEAYRIAAEFKGKTASEDSGFMMQENDNGNVIVNNFDKKSMIVRDSSIFSAAPGTVFGPYNEGAYFKVYKLQAVNSVNDSARVRHILVGINDPESQQPKRSMPQAKREADSLLTLIKDRKVSFDSLVTNFSDDMGSRNNGGDYGWFDENEGFVDPFKYAGLMGRKGDISVVETQFGYHIIEVLDVSQSKHKSYRVAEVQKMIAPSEETTQKVFARANEFAGENNTADLFDKAVEEQKLAKRVASDISEGDYQLPGLDNAKELARWAYTAEKGDVSIFTMPNRFVVAKLSAVKNKGQLPLEEVRDEVALKVRQEKKAQKYVEEFNKAGSQSIDQIAQKLNLRSQKQDNLIYVAGTVDGVGIDNVMTGTAAGLGKGNTCKPTISANGVFVLKVEDVMKNPAPQTFDAQKSELEGSLASRSDYEVFNALKEVAEIEFHKSKID